MAGEREENGKSFNAFLALAIVIVAGFAFSYLQPQPTVKTYPNREKVIFWHMWTAEWKGVIDKIALRFNESQDKYEVIALSIPSSVADSKFLLAVAGGNPPDVMGQWSPVIPKWAESKLLQPLDGFMTPAEWLYFQKYAYPAAKRIGMYKGKLYGIPSGMNAFACYYMPNQFVDAGLDPNKFPDTLEKLTAIGHKLNRFDDKGNLTRIGFLPSQWPGVGMYAPGYGGGYYDWKHDKLTINTPINLKVLTYLVDERKRLGFDNVLRFESGLNSGSSGSVDWPFISGAYSITLDGQWRVEQLRKFAPDLKYKTAPLPPPAGGPKNYGWTNGNFLIIPKGAKHSKGAWEFIKFWSGIAKPERAAEFYTWGGWIPLFPAEANSPIFKEYVKKNPEFQTFLDVAASEHIYPIPPVPYQVFLSDRIGRYEDLAIRSRLTPQEALKQLDQDIKQELDRRKRYHYND